jgi:hypothetical protein
MNVVDGVLKRRQASFLGPELELFLRHTKLVQRERHGTNGETLRDSQGKGSLRQFPELRVERGGTERDTAYCRGIISIGQLEAESPRRQPPPPQAVSQPLADQPEQRQNNLEIVGICRQSMSQVKL